MYENELGCQNRKVRKQLPRKMWHWWWSSSWSFSRSLEIWILKKIFLPFHVCVCCVAWFFTIIINFAYSSQTFFCAFKNTVLKILFPISLSLFFLLTKTRRIKERVFFILPLARWTESEWNENNKKYLFASGADEREITTIGGVEKFATRT